MKTRLFYKFFFLSLFTSIFVVIFMVAVMHFSVYRNFSTYVAKTELNGLDKLVFALGMEYRENNGWETFRQSDRPWHRLLRKYLPNREPGLPPPPRPEKTEFTNVGPRDEHGKHFYERQGPGIIRNPRPSELPPNPPPISSLGRRLSLFDARKKIIIGNSNLSDQILRPIEIDKKTVGWLGVKKPRQLTNPADIAFLKQQSRIFYLIGAMVLILAIIVSAFFSNHLLAPVRKIAEGTKAIRNRRFNTRIAVSTKDELGELADDFNMMAQHLETYEAMRRQWLSDISHELRTPLAVLRGEIEALQDGIREKSPQAIASLHAEVIHLSNIVNDLNQLSQIESGVFEMKKALVNPIVVLRDTLERFANRFNQREISVEADFKDASGINITGDFDRLSQVFSNIFENILRYAGSSVFVKVWYVRTRNDITIFIEDSGPGVPEESLKKLFDRFYRTDAARTRNTGGSGLGLAICKSIVEGHRGEISAASGTSGGLRISLKFPLNT